jgi:hypothetical protein
MVILELAPRGGTFSTSSSITIGNDTSTCNDPCAPSEDYSIAAGNSSWVNAHTSDPSSKGKRLGGERSTLLQQAQHTNGSSNG